MARWISPFEGGFRISGYTFDALDHPAIDIVPAIGDRTGLLAVADGRCVGYGRDAGDGPGSNPQSRGIWMRIQHDDGTSVEHCHLAGVPWPVDDRYNPDHMKNDPTGKRFTQGQPLGVFMGETGHAYGPHDHLIARNEGGTRVDPMIYFSEGDEEVPLTPEQEADLRLGASIRPHLQNAIDVTRGWGGRLTKPGIPRRAEEQQAGRELTDVAKALQEAMDGAQ